MYPVDKCNIITAMYCIGIDTYLQMGGYRRVFPYVESIAGV